jgi:hypothetical protein
MQRELDELRAIHAETVDLLERVQDYLVRLPPVPVTVDLCREIAQHLESPKAAALARAARKSVLANEARHGTCYSPAGIPLLLIDIEAGSLTLGTEI